MDQVWGVNGDHLSIMPSEGDIKLFSGDCHIVKYTYQSSQRDESILYAWLGTASIKVKAIFLLRLFSIKGCIKGFLLHKTVLST